MSNPWQDYANEKILQQTTCDNHGRLGIPQLAVLTQSDIVGGWCHVVPILRAAAQGCNGRHVNTVLCRDMFWLCNCIYYVYMIIYTYMQRSIDSMDSWFCGTTFVIPPLKVIKGGAQLDTLKCCPNHWSWDVLSILWWVLPQVFKRSVQHVSQHVVKVRSQHGSGICVWTHNSESHKVRIYVAGWTTRNYVCWTCLIFPTGSLGLSQWNVNPGQVGCPKHWNIQLASDVHPPLPEMLRFCPPKTLLDKDRSIWTSTTMATKRRSKGYCLRPRWLVTHCRWTHRIPHELVTSENPAPCIMIYPYVPAHNDLIYSQTSIHK